MNNPNPFSFTALIILCAFGDGHSYAINVPDNGAKDIKDKLGIAWRETNRVDGNEEIARLDLPVPSTSVGDIIAIDGRHFIVDGIGFMEVSAQVAIAWQSLPSRDVSAGWAFVTKHAPQVNVRGCIVKMEGKAIDA